METQVTKERREFCRQERIQRNELRSSDYFISDKPKKCKVCGLMKTFKDFNKNFSRLDGIHTVCSECVKIDYQLRYSDPQKRKRRNKKALQLYYKNPEPYVIRSTKWHNEHPKEVKISQRKTQLKVVGQTPEGYHNLELIQNYLCAICKQSNTKGRDLNQDHCHLTGKLRELLCDPCNFGLGKFKDNRTFLLKAIEYLCRDVVEFNYIVKNILHLKIANKRQSRRQEYLKYEFGINVEGYAWMCDYFNNKCAICFRDKNINKNNWCIDHNKKTEEIRGLLCDNCNTGLGCFKDSPVLLQSAIDYLKQYEETNLENEVY